MSTPLPAWAADSKRAASSGRSLRSFGILVLVMFLLTSAVGGSLGLESSYLLITLVSHIGLALVTLGIAGYTASTVGRQYPTRPRAFAGLAAFAALGGTIAGTVFLLVGHLDAPLYVMEGFAVLGIIAAVGMIGAGGISARMIPDPSSA